jgi:transketolase
MDQKAINVIRNLALDMIMNTGSGHPGISISSAPILYTLFTKYLNINPSTSDWINRDRFILSSSNATETLYATMFLCGYPLMLDDLKSYRKYGSKLPATSTIGTFGIDISTGFPSEGFASATGIALAESIYEQKYNYKNKGIFDKVKLPKLFDYYTYVLIDDEEIMDGLNYEAASFAGNYHLGKLIVLWVSTGVTRDGAISNSFYDDTLSRFSSLGWSTKLVKDGNSVNEISNAIRKAKEDLNHPTIIKVDSILGDGLRNQGTNLVFSESILKADIDEYKKKIGVGTIPFTLLKEPASYMRDQVVNRGNKIYDDWKKIYNDYKTVLSQEQIYEIENINYNNISFKLDNIDIPIDYENKELLRDSNHRIINIISNNVYNFIGGSANLYVSTKTYLDNGGNLTSNNLLGKNIMFGGRNALMGSTMNGLAISGFRPFVSTHMAYASKLMPAIKMSALMNLPVTYIFTHDSITVGNDGPVNQPINELASLRSVPNLYVFRPADIKEVIGTWNIILANQIPAVISLPKTEIKAEQGTSKQGVVKGAYIAGKEQSIPSLVMLATGAEVQVAKSIHAKLLQEGIDSRVVSMPCMELYNLQPASYKQELFPKNVPIFVIEYGSSFGFEKFVPSSDYLFTINKFGICASKEDVIKYMNLDLNTMIEKIKSLL